jgi:hypothetical protein
MQLPIFAHTWHGLDLSQFPAAKDAHDKPAGPEFYDQFYSELSKRPVDPNFKKGKASFGSISESQFIQPWREKHGREPRILSLGVGKGYIEEVWLERGHHVTLQECQPHSLTEALAKYPNARGIVGDAVTMDYGGEYNIIAAMAIDSCLGRDGLRDLFKNIRRSLSKDGFVLFHCAASLSVRQYLAETAKDIMGTRKAKPHVFWGWWRSVGEICDLAAEAKLKTMDVYRFPRTDQKELIRRPALMRRWMTMRDALIAATFSPA